MAAEHVERRAPLTDGEIEEMMATLVRKPETFSIAKDSLEPAHFAAHQKHFAAIWAACLDFHAENEELPRGFIILHNFVNRRLQEDDSLSDEEVELLELTLKNIYAYKLKQLRSEAALSKMRRLLESDLTRRIRTSVASEIYEPNDIFGILETFKQQAEEIKSVSFDDLEERMPVNIEQWDNLEDAEHEIKVIPTGLDFFDSMLGGGPAVGECVGFLAPHGSCKTTLAIQLATMTARAARMDWLRSGRTIPLRFSYYFFWEGTYAQMITRAMSSLGQIHRKSFEVPQYKKHMSTSDNLKDYEKLLFAEAIQQNLTVFGEHERGRLAGLLLNENVRFFEMTGGDKAHPGRGGNMIQEVERLIKQHQVLLKKKGITAEVGPIFIDYVGAAVERHLYMNNKDHRDLRHMLVRFPLWCQNTLAAQFDTWVMCLHQLSGAANSLSAGAKVSGTMAAEAKSFRENLDWLLVAGTPTAERLSVISLDKMRRGSSMPDQIIRIKGEINRVVGTNGKYTIDPTRRQIVETRSLRAIASFDSPTIDDSNEDPPAAASIRTSPYDEVHARGRRQ